MAASWPGADRATLVTLATVLAATGADHDGLSYFEALAASRPDQVLPLALAGYFQVRAGEDIPAGVATLDDAASRDLGLAQYYRGLALAPLPTKAGHAEQARRPALDRPHRGTTRGARGGGGVVNGANGSSAVKVGGAIIEGRDLVLSFGETPALRGASISVKKGEVLAVMGPSGSGKSTLLHCLAGILVPDSGEVYFDGQRLDTMREAERSRLRRDRFGFVFQFGQLVPELTAEENVALPLLLGGTHRDQALRAARSWFERLDLQGMERHRTGEMSGGQSQRVALARGLVAHPDVLFADEPTGSLDSLNGELVMGLLTRAAREQGSTVIVVTHDPRVAAYADREVIVRDGRVTTTEAVPG